MLIVTLGCSDRKVLAQDSTEESISKDAISKNQVALPEQISIDAPDQEVSSELAVFSGAWAGDGWNGAIPTALVVEKIDQNGSASVIFAWGDIIRAKRPRGWFRVKANIDKGKLGFSITDYGSVEFSVTLDGRLLGRYTYTNGRRDYTILTRVAPANSANIIAASQHVLSSETVTFPVASSSDPKQTVQLHGILYRSPIPGPRPLAIFSGDSVVSEASRARPNAAPIKSRQMLGLGYSLLVLQRKGTGGSGGSFVEPREESIPQRIQLQSALDDLDAAVTFMKRQEYVDPSRIVVMGINRGGLLSVAYAGLHDGAVAGVINTLGHWRVHRNWWQRLFTWEDFTATQFANAGKNTKIPMLWIYGGSDPSGLEYARNNYRGFTYQGGRGTFVDMTADGKSDPSAASAFAKEDRAITDYIQNLGEKASASAHHSRSE